MAVFKKAAKDDPKPEKHQPAFIVRAKQSADSDFWDTIGAAWPANFKDGSTGYSVKINKMPVNWNGDCLLMKPKKEE